MLTFEALYESQAVEVYRFAFWLTGQASEAEDITSETFVRAWVHRSPIRTETLKAYLFTIARNVFLEQIRKGRHQVALTGEFPDPGPDPARVAESRQDLRRVQKLLMTLPEVDRAAFVMLTQHGLPYAEIARALGLSLASTKVKIHRVRKRLLEAHMDQEV